MVLIKISTDCFREKYFGDKAIAVIVRMYERVL